jgi:PAS domain S-box-containing protein
MQPSADLSALLRAYVEQQTDAFTVAAWVRLTDTIADAQFLLASPAGAAIYGFLPEELVGQYLSQRHTPEDHYKGLKLATARRLGRVVPQPYPTRILTRNGTFRPVIKRVRMIDLAATTLWITHLLPARKMLPTPDIDLGPAENLQDDQRRFTRSISVAEATRAFAEGLPHVPYERMGREAESLQLHLPYSQYTDKSIEKCDEPAPEGFFLEPGATVQLPQGRKGAVKRPFLHWCKVCNETSRSDDPEPAQCPRRACRSPNWRTGR